MNPLTKVKLINELNEREAKLGVKDSVSWHLEYKESAWIFVGGFPYELTEGDIICVFSQYGEIVNINLVRDKKTGKSKGFCFICYEDQRSTILAVDNFNGIKIKGRTIRVDHVKDYKPPKEHEDIDDITKQLRDEGCAPKPSDALEDSEEEDEIPTKKSKKDKKEKKKKKKEKKEKKREKERERAKSSSSPSSSPSPPRVSPSVQVKEEKQDAAYDKYNQRGAPSRQQTHTQQQPRPLSRQPRSRSPPVKQENGGRERERQEDRRRDGERERTRETHRENDRPRERDRDGDYERKRENDGDRESNRRRDTERDGEHERRRESDRDRDRRRDTDRERHRKH